jgi:asparagine synthase (glutamine-hydrolysing)
MCGICGIVGSRADRPVPLSLLESMTRTLVHRGPDEQRTQIDGNVGLGHCRLKIIDLTADARQPMSNEDDSNWLVFNGEIYNHLALRRELEQKGHRFKSRSDTEVILHLYEEHEEECLSHLRGMFAFAIWDTARKKLFLARDRLGQKPLFYAQTADRLVFASEIKALLQDPDVDRTPNPQAIHHYLSLSYVAGIETAFKGIQRVAPAHKLVYKDGEARTSRYWRLSFAGSTALRGRGTKQVEEELLARFEEAVSLRLMSDVPLGALLSGGIDSSAVVAMMARSMDRPVKTFTISFEEKSHDESAYARAVAERYATEHREYTVRPDLVETLPSIVEQYDEPFADPSALPTFYLAKVVSEHVTVALNGDGGDECFAGYDRYVKNRVSGYYLKMPRALRRLMATMFAAVPGGLRQQNILKRLKNYVRAEELPLDRLYCRWLLLFDRQQKQGLYSDGFAKALDVGDTEDLIIGMMKESNGEGVLEASLRTDALSYLPDDLLVKMDRACMAHSLENRSPFLDHEFMEFVAALPTEMKLRGLTRKWILKRAFKGILPGKILHRRKRGFGLPIDRWLRNDLKDMVQDTLLARSAVERGYFRKSTVKRLLEQHMSGQCNWQFHIWNLLMLELWHRHFIDGARDGARVVP